MSKQSEYEWLQERENQEAIDRQFSDEEEIDPDMDVNPISRNKENVMKKTIFAILILMVVAGCDLSQYTNPPAPPVSTSGVTKARARVTVGSNGLTVEQKNIKERLQEDNKPGAIKHF